MTSARGAATFRAPAQAYDRFMGRYGPRLSKGLIEVAGIKSGMSVLDVGCGPGGLARALADVTGAERVAAVDPSEPFVEACRERLPAADVRLGAAEDLPWPDDSFDAALSQLVVNFMTDAERGVGEMARVVHGGGRVAACVWDYGDGMVMLRAFWDAAREVAPAEATEADEARMRYSSPEELGGVWRAVGLQNVEVGELNVGADYESFDDLWIPFTMGVGPAGTFCTSLDSERQEALRAALARRVGEPTGPFSLDARAWYAVGRA